MAQVKKLLLPGNSPSAFPPHTLSLCMIVKNEEASLPQCLETMRSVADEIVIVDTGSTDRTKEIARSFGAKIVDDPWQGDFSRARNCSIDHASCSWILWLDADDRVEPSSLHHISRIKKEVLHLDTAFGFRVKNLKAGGLGDVFMQIRMFPNDPRVRFEKKIHEQVSPALARAGYTFLYLNDTEIVHTGYAHEGLKHEKALRNRKILEDDMKNYPDDINYLAAYADTFFITNEWERGIEVYQEVMAIPGAQHKQTDLYNRCPVLIALGYQQLRQFPRALQWIESGLSLAPGRADLFLIGGEVLFEMREFARARGMLEKALGAPEQLSSVPIDYQAIRVKASIMLARICREEKDFAGAEAWYRKIMASHPYFFDMPANLGEVALEQGRLLDAMRFFSDSVIRFPGADVRAYRQLGRISASVGKIDEAIDMYNKGISFFPADRVMLEALRDLYRTRDDTEKYLDISRRLAEMNRSG